jgi:hypothetical protein
MTANAAAEKIQTIRGRPRKNTAKRIQTTIYADLDVLDQVDRRVSKLRELGDNASSRSELYHRAMVSWLARN